MNEIINAIVSTCLQVIVFTLIPFIFFLFRKDKSVSFLRYIGLCQPTGKSLAYGLLAVLLFLIPGLGMTLFEDMRQLLLHPNSVTGKLHQIGFTTQAVIILLLTALFKTALAEEILFRGFIAKRLINKLGFQNGNILQAAIFGLIHLLLFGLLAQAAIIPLVFIFIFSAGAGWTICYINEKFANGSIVPGWITHALGNAISYFIIAFVI